jgi:histidine triad (HIT) family protein
VPAPPVSTTCLFCRIVGGDVPAHVVADEPGYVAFLDHRPLFPGHTLVVPRPHVATLLDLPGADVGPYFAAVQRLTAAVTEGMDAVGTFVAMNNVVSQSVPHLHVHVVPRRPKDGLRGFFWPRTKYASDDDARAAAEAVRGALA